MQPDFRGARGSSTGDDFHEWWALRHAMALLDDSSSLIMLTVEGVRLEDEVGTKPDTWDGVDCALYYGCEYSNTINRIVIEQLKYSAANPEKPWTVSRLKYYPKHKKNNSIIKKLADAFLELSRKHPDLSASNNLEIRFVSNQPLDGDIPRALIDSKSEDYKALRSASGLRLAQFKEFAAALDFSLCGADSRFRQEEKAILTISSLTEGDAQRTALDLKDRIHRLMLPEAKGEFISKETVLSWMGLHDLAAMFPCSSEITKVVNYVSREVAHTVIEKMKNGKQYLCLHGVGACGKTTVLQEIEELLPPTSTMLVFDCYGDGRYLDSDAYRHRPQDAFLQLINELASVLRAPFPVVRDPNLNYPKVFKRHLDHAGQIIEAKDKNALLVIVIDAADCSVAGAGQCTPPEVSFVHEFSKLGSLPKNVHILVTTRTGRLSSLNLSDRFECIVITGFNPRETEEYVRNIWPEAPDTWVEDFHALSNGNPRSQSYVFDQAGSRPEDALTFLRPNGKTLDQIFDGLFDLAVRRDGDIQSIKLLCAGLISLPSPVPIKDLAAVTNLNDAHVRDIFADLPGLRLNDDLVGFADEDFEYYIREKGQEKTLDTRDRIADHFLENYETDEYASMHLASALYEADRGNEVIDLIDRESVPKAVSDQILRQEAQRQRLRIAMKVCRASGDIPDALYTLLVGAEAMKTDEAVHRTIIENPDLAVHFSRDTIGRAVLYNAKDVEHHGKFLFHLLAKDAQAGDGIAVRDKARLLHEWMQRRKEDLEKQRRRHRHANAWPINSTDIAAATEAKLRSEGCEQAVKYLLRWHPRSRSFHVVSLLVKKLIASSEVSLVKTSHDQGCIPEPWSFLLSIPLALAGEAIDMHSLVNALGHKMCRRLIRTDRLAHFGDEERSDDYLDLVLTGCEIAISNGADKERLRPLLHLFLPDYWRRRDKIFSSDYVKIDLGVRAFCLLERMDGNIPDLESYWIAPPEPSQGISETERRRFDQDDKEKKKELKDIIGPLIVIYDYRAQVLLSLVKSDLVEKELNKALQNFHSESWRISRQHHLGTVTTKLAQAMTHLNAIPSMEPAVVWRLTKAAFKAWPNGFSKGQQQALSTLSLVQPLHPEIQIEVKEMAHTVIQEKTAASEKIEALLALARIMLPINRNESKSLFNLAIGVASEVDVDAMHEIALFEPMAKCAVSGLDIGRKRDIAHRIAAITNDAGIRLEGYDHFPWDKSVTAVATLDISLALATAAIWEDTGTADCYYVLSSIISTGLEGGSLSSVFATGLLHLVDRPDADQLTKILSNTDQMSIVPIAEELARLELLRFSKIGRTTVNESIISQMPSLDSAGYWVKQLGKICSFWEKHKVSDKSTEPITAEEVLQRDTEKSQIFSEIDWSRYQLNEAESIISLLQEARLLAKKQKTYLGNFDIICAARNYIKLDEQIAFIETLIKKELKEELAYDWARTIMHFLYLWSESSLAVRDFKREHLPALIQENLPDFSRYYPYGHWEYNLPQLLDSLGLSDDSKVDLILHGIETNSEHFNVGTLYALVGLIAKYSPARDAADIIDRYSSRLLKRVPEKDRELFKLDDLPNEIDKSCARYIYALMGDVDVRIRWRAAHVVRCVVRLGEKDLLNEITALYDKKLEPNYRAPDAPFYWIAARLWLLIALNRIAEESSSSITPLAPFLLRVATDDEFPHLLLRSYAKQTLISLSNGDADLLTPGERATTDAINTSPIARKEANQKYPRVDRFRKQKGRFQFDSLDTLPYWYPSAIRVFADVDQEDFLRMAEHWIIDRWSEKDSVWLWDWQKRISRFSEGDYRLWSHGQGSMPTIERYNNYLEWHAMWCAAGELMKSRPLALSEDDEEYGTLEYWLSNAGLTEPPLWLSDLRGVKPLESQIWFAPKIPVEQWIDDISNDDFLIEIGLDNEENMIVVDGYHQNRSERYNSNVSVSTALVAPKTADALVRALQTANDSRDYRLPPNGHSLEIDHIPFQLRGWLTESEGDLLAERKDPFRNGVGMIASRPAPEVIEILGLIYKFDHKPTWVDEKSGSPACIYEAWGDTPGDKDENNRLYGTDPDSGGCRLSIGRKALATYINELGFELIMEVQITREKNRDRHSRFNKETQKEARFSRIILLKRDGGIYAAEGRIGSWILSS